MSQQPPRKANFVCDCCPGKQTANFCIYMFGIYGLLTMLILIGFVYFQYKKSRNEAQLDERLQKRSFKKIAQYGLSDGILPWCKVKTRQSYLTTTAFLILLSFSTRLIYLSEGIQCKMKGYSQQAVSFEQQQWSQTIPFYFKIMIIINILDFKIHTLYITRSQKAPWYCKLLLFVLYFLAFTITIVSPIYDSSDAITDEQSAIYNVTILFTTLVPVSIISIYYLVKLNRSTWFSQEAFVQIRRKLILLEILIQISLIGRLLAAILFYYIAPRAVINQTAIILYIAGGLIFSETIPLILMIYGISAQIDWSQKRVRQNSEISENYRSRSSGALINSSMGESMIANQDDKELINSSFQEEDEATRQSIIHDKTIDDCLRVSMSECADDSDNEEFVLEQ